MIGVAGSSPARRLALAAALAVGCVSKPPLAIQSYAIDPPPPRAGAASSGAAVVSLSRVGVAPPYAGTSFVYRTGEHRIERDPYAVFAAAPGWMLTAAIRGYLRNSDFVRDVVDPAGNLPVDVAIEADASELCADLSGAGEAAAVLTLRFRVLSPADGITPAKELLQKTYARRLALGERTPASIAQAWNRELSEIMREFEADLKPVLPARPE
jgi:uncharacterized lipoprotein YmbA